jgi:pimeloyl-ACP methyl ester carboxylesterase
MKTKLVGAALACAVAFTTTQAQTPAPESVQVPIPKTAAAPAKAEEGIVKLADSSIQYFSRGEGETIVMLPGGTLTVGYLDGLAEALVKEGYRVVGINFRGSGKSTGPSEGVTLQTNADDVVGVIQDLKLGPVHVVGEDFGNRVARMLAASHPELTRSVILLGPGGKFPPKPAALRAEKIAFNPKSTEAEVLAAFSYFVASSADSARVWALLKPSVDTKAGGIEMAAMKATPLKVWWAPPGKTKYLILQGAEDQIAPTENGVDLKKEMGDRVTLITVPGAGHLLPLEQPEKTVPPMIRFIQQIGGNP